jgi:hypothetical protein
MHFLTVTLLWHTAHFTSVPHCTLHFSATLQTSLPLTQWSTQNLNAFVTLQPLLQGNKYLYHSCVFYPFYRRLKVGDWIFIFMTLALNSNFNFAPTLLCFTLPGYWLSWLNCHNFPHSAQDSTISRAWVFLIWYCVVCSKSLVSTIIHICTLHAWYCVGAMVMKLTYYLNYKRHVSWWMDGGVLIRHITRKKNDWYKLQRDIRYIIQYLLEIDLEQMIVNGTQQGWQ